MALRKPTTRADTKKKPTAKKGENRVVKRPARGYHTFRNGMLNVSPMGDEKELVKNNKDSPLLRLPPEIRNRIWEITLGGKVVREAFTWRRRSSVRMLPEPCSRNTTFALLRTCRQIHAETAVMPFTVNTFSFRTYWNIGRKMKAFRKYQCGQVSDVRFEITSSEMGTAWSKKWLKRKFDELQLRKWLPGLRRIHICIYPSQNWVEVTFADCEAFLRSDIVPDMLARGYEITTEKMSTDWSTFDQEWCGASLLRTVLSESLERELISWIPTGMAPYDGTA